jgi:hypothetical protein
MLIANSQTNLDRRAELVEANIAAVHAHQVMLAAKSGRSFPLYRAVDGADLPAMVAHQRSLFAEGVGAIKAWLDGKPSTIDRMKDLNPILGARLPMADSLPVNVFTRYLLARTGASVTDARSIANLYQIVLEIDRDGNVFQQLQKFYIDLGLAVYWGQLPGKNAPGNSDAELLEMGEQLAAQTCESPFATDAAAWQITAKKIWIWGQRHLHIRDAEVLASELMREDDIRKLLPQVRAMAPRKIAIIGHSFTMPVNWSTPTSFSQIVITIFERLNPAVQFRHWQKGGMNALQAKELFCAEATAWKPDLAFIFVLAATPQELSALADIRGSLAAAGARPYFFPHNGPGPYNNVSTLRRFAASQGLALADFDDVVQAAPNKSEFVSLDKIHMTEPYHRLMAREFLRFLIKHERE